MPPRRYLLLIGLMNMRPAFSTAYLAEVGHVAEAVQDTEHRFSTLDFTAMGRVQSFL